MSSTNPAPAAEQAAAADLAPEQAAVAAPEATEAAEAAASAPQPTAAPADAEPAPQAAAAAPAAPARTEPSTAATAARLAELFPALFTGAPKPLKLRIQADIQERAPGEFSKTALSAFLRRLTGATSYLVAVSRGKQRFDLDGQPAGELSEEHRQVATDELTRRRANQQARREQEEAGRRERFSLLRDFETTKLTTANFCALKGIAPEALDGLLAQARTEAAEEASRPRRPDDARRDGRRDGPRGGQGPRGAAGQGPRRDGAPRRGPPRG
ncbi:MAG: ProQ/FinO family protein [Burkholderiales bacterium]|nr:ProQ/FinO family protein [Burkholderiales bacterium]